MWNFFKNINFEIWTSSVTGSNPIYVHPILKKGKNYFYDSRLDWILKLEKVITGGLGPGCVAYVCSICMSCSIELN